MFIDQFLHSNQTTLSQNSSQVQSWLLKIIRLTKRWLPWGVISLGLIISLSGLAGLIWQTNFSSISTDSALSANLSSGQEKTSDITEGSNDSTTSPSEWLITDSAGQLELVVDVSGAVNQPGVYRLPEGERVAAAIATAQGISSEADPRFVAEQLNLASTLSDGQKIFIPRFDPVAQSISTTGEGKSNSTNSNDKSSAISINNATQKELETLSGVGEVRAKAIISNRPYQSIEDLVTKKVLSQSIFDENQALLTL